MPGLLEHSTNQWNWQNLTGLELRSLLRGQLILGAWVCYSQLQCIMIWQFEILSGMEPINILALLYFSWLLMVAFHVLLLA